MSTTTFEPLNPEFGPYSAHHPEIGLCIKHPLYYSLGHKPSDNAHANRILATKRKHLASAEREGRWLSWLVLHERPWRLKALVEIEDRVGDSDYWQLLRHAWIDSENIWQDEAQWIELLTSKRPQQDQLMSADDYAAFERLPATVTIYRGFAREDRDFGLSWSLDRDQAIWFAERFVVMGPPQLTTARISKDKIVAHFTERGEKEIIALPADVDVVSVEQL